MVVDRDVLSSRLDTSAGYIDRATGDVFYLSLAADEKVENGIAIGEDGIYVLTSKALYGIDKDPVGNAVVVNWREPYEVDPLICPECASPMRVISIIEEQEVIRRILEHLKLWEDPEPRPPPAVPEQVDIQYVPFFDS